MAGNRPHRRPQERFSAGGAAGGLWNGPALAPCETFRHGGEAVLGEKSMPDWRPAQKLAESLEPLLEKIPEGGFLSPNDFVAVAAIVTENRVDTFNSILFYDHGRRILGDIARVRCVQLTMLFLMVFGMEDPLSQKLESAVPSFYAEAISGMEKLNPSHRKRKPWWRFW